MLWTKPQISTLESLYTIIRAVFLAHDLSSIRSPPADGLTADGAMTLPLPEVVRVELVERADRLIAVLIQGIALEDALQAMQHCSIENPTFSAALFTRILHETAMAEPLKPVLDALLRLLQTEDSLQGSRIVAFYEGDGSVQGLLSLASSCRGANPKRAYQYIKFVTEVMHQVPQVGAYLKSQDSWQTMIVWLEGQLASYSPNAHFAKQSNETDESSRYFMRTTSAQKTLIRAKDLIDDCAPFLG